MLTVSEESPDRMVQRADPGREPQLHRRGQRQLGVVDHRFDQQARVAHAGFVAGLVGVAGSGGQLGHRQRGRDREVGEGASVPVGVPDRHDLARVDRTSSAEAHHSVGAGARSLIDARVASAEDIMTIASEVQHPGWAYLAPQAVGNAWYPNPFTAPLESNEPYLSAALDMISKLVERVEPTVPAQRIMLLGFSQGACLTLECAARNARRYGAIAGLSGGLIGPEGTPRDYPGDFDATPVFLRCSDVDPYIRKDRVVEAADVFNRMGADLTVRLYPGMGHMVGPEEIAIVRGLVESI